MNQRKGGENAPAVVRFHGRRHGRRLRPGRRGLLNALLPHLAVPLPSPCAPSLEPATLFGRPVSDVWLEIGFGAGEHLIAQATHHPEIGFIGCEPFVNGVAALLARVRETAIDNIRVHAEDARPLLSALADASVGRVFVLFPDPWPKTRHHGRRFIGPSTIPMLARVMRDGAELWFATDHMGAARWTLQHLTRHPAFAWTAQRPTDWRNPPKGWQPTRYQAKAAANGDVSVYLQFRRQPRSCVA